LSSDNRNYARIASRVIVTRATFLASSIMSPGRRHLYTIGGELDSCQREGLSSGNEDVVIY
jgi:hypothetical protein